MLARSNLLLPCLDLRLTGRRICAHDAVDDPLDLQSSASGVSARHRGSSAAIEWTHVWRRVDGDAATSVAACEKVKVVLVLLLDLLDRELLERRFLVVLRRKKVRAPGTRVSAEAFELKSTVTQQAHPLLPRLARPPDVDDHRVAALLPVRAGVMSLLGGAAAVVAGQADVDTFGRVLFASRPAHASVGDLNRSKRSSRSYLTVEAESAFLAMDGVAPVCGVR